MVFGILAFFLIFTASSAFADTPAASRVEGEAVYYYPSLHEAFEAASSALADAGTSIDTPDEISVLSDITLDDPIIIDAAKHIRLVAANGSRTIQRGSGNLEYPLLWLTGDSATLTLGKPGMEHEFIFDGGYASAGVKALAPLITINGPNSKLVMHDNVILQNNYNTSTGAGTTLYQNGAGVYIRTTEDNFHRQAEFIMKGGIIRGNSNDVQNPYASGGGVFIFGAGVFTMEGGTIMNNSASRSGGGVHFSSRGTFKKTGGIIHGIDAPDGCRNTAINGTGSPKTFGHAVYAALINEPAFLFRDNTVHENDHLSYTGSQTTNGVFGQGDKWDTPKPVNRPRWLIGTVSALALIMFLLFLAIKRKQQAFSAGAAIEPIMELTPREREFFDLLLTEISTKEIAGELDLTYSGANFHIQKLYNKLGVQNRTELFSKFIKK